MAMGHIPGKVRKLRFATQLEYWNNGVVGCWAEMNLAKLNKNFSS
jgi:hypothetical protein